MTYKDTEASKPIGMQKLLPLFLLSYAAYSAIVRLRSFNYPLPALGYHNIGNLKFKFYKGSITVSQPFVLDNLFPKWSQKMKNYISQNACPEKYTKFRKNKYVGMSHLMNISKRVNKGIHSLFPLTYIQFWKSLSQ